MKVLHYNSSEWTNKNIISSFLESGFLVVNFPFADISGTLESLKDKLKDKLNEPEENKIGWNEWRQGRISTETMPGEQDEKVILRNMTGSWDCCNTIRSRFLKVGCEILYAIEEFLDVKPNSITMKHADSDNDLRFVKYYRDQKGPIRVGEHCDFGTVTLVHVCDPVEEYEIFYEDKWRTIEHPSNDFLIVNIGDFMQIWSDNKLFSTPHRITNRTKKERHSLIMFMDAGNHTIKGIDHADWNKDRIKKAKEGLTYYHVT